MNGKYWNYKKEHKKYVREVILILALGAAISTKVWFMAFILGVCAFIYYTRNEVKTRKAGIKLKRLINTWRKHAYELKNPEIITIENHKLVSHKLREMLPKDFEEFVEILFELKGYTIEFRSKFKADGKHGKADGGKDIIATKGDERIVVQCKKIWKKQISVEMIRGFNTTFEKLNPPATKAIFITTSIFSEPAKKSADECGITLVDYEGILQLLVSVSGAKDYKEKLEEFLNSREYWRNRHASKHLKTCPKCYAPLVWKPKLHGFGCLNYHAKDCTYKEV